MACSATQDAADNTGVISMYNVGPSNGNADPPDYNAWGACNEGATFGAGSHRLPHGEQCFMIDDADGFVWVELDQVSLTAMVNPVASICKYTTCLSAVDKQSYPSLLVSRRPSLTDCLCLRVPRGPSRERLLRARGRDPRVGHYTILWGRRDLVRG